MLISKTRSRCLPRRMTNNALHFRFKKAMKTPEFANIDSEIQTEFLDHGRKHEEGINGVDSIFELSCSKYDQFWESECDFSLNWKDKGYNILLDLLTVSCSERV